MARPTPTNQYCSRRNKKKLLSESDRIAVEWLPEFRHGPGPVYTNTMSKTAKTTQSMTAFSSREASFDWGTLLWEIRSVNHRYLDVNCRLPEKLRSLEPVVRDTVRKKLQRGKVDCTLHFVLRSEANEALEINEVVLQQYLDAVAAVNKRLDTPAATSSLDLLAKPNVIVESELDKEQLVSEATQLFNTALTEHVEGREREGKEMANFICQRLDKIDEHVATIRPRIPEIIDQQKGKLLARLEELKSELDESRLEQEIAYLAQKLDVDEELDRLVTHVNEVKRVLDEGGSIGRRLDFLMQELNREANTLSSKSITSETTLAAVELKVLIEQMREQIQNLV